MTTAPARARRASRVDSDLNTEEAPFPVDGAEEETAPRRRRPRPAEKVVDEEPDEEPKKATRRTRESVEDEAVGEETDIPIAIGRKNIKIARPQSEGSAIYFRWSDDGEPQVVKFLDVEPWSYNQHWVTREGKASFPCIGRPGVKCPLCEVGVRASQKIVYSIVNLSHQDGPTVQVIEVGMSLDETLAAYDTDKKTGPLSRLWWALSRSKGARSTNSRAKYNYLLSPIKDRDLEEDYAISLGEAEDATESAEALAPADVLGKWGRAELQEIADEVMGK